MIVKIYAATVHGFRDNVQHNYTAASEDELYADLYHWLDESGALEEKLGEQFTDDPQKQRKSVEHYFCDNDFWALTTHEREIDVPGVVLTDGQLREIRDFIQGIVDDAKLVQANELWLDAGSWVYDPDAWGATQRAAEPLLKALDRIGEELDG